MPRDIVDAIDRRIARKSRNTQTTGKVINVVGNQAMVKIGGSNALQPVLIDQKNPPTPGAMIALSRVAGQQRWVISNSFSTPAQGVVVGGATSALGAVTPQSASPPSVPINFKTKALPGSTAYEWYANQSQGLTFEIQTDPLANADTAQTVLITQGSYYIAQGVIPVYARIRAINRNLQASAWSPWVLSSATALEGVLRYATIDLNWYDTYPKALTTIANGEIVSRAKLIVDTPFTGSGGAGPYAITFSVGEVGGPTRILDDTHGETDATWVTSYEVEPDYQYLDNTTLNAYLHLTGYTALTAGAGRIVLLIRALSF